ANVVVVLDVLLGDELPQHIDVAVGHLVGREDVVVRYNDDLFPVPDLGARPEMLLENADGAGAADVVGHQDVHVDPNIVARLHAIAVGSSGKNLLRQGHHEIYLGISRLLRTTIITDVTRNNTGWAAQGQQPQGAFMFARTCRLQT